MAGHPPTLFGCVTGSASIARSLLCCTAIRWSSAVKVLYGASWMYPLSNWMYPLSK